MATTDRIAVDQPPGGGTTYPFAEPDPLVPLVADFYLSYVDTPGAFVLPLQLVWLYGFGTDPASVPGMPTPVHARELLILDAADAVVFDSTEAEFVETTWDNKRVTQWTTADQVAKLVSFTDDMASWPEAIATASVLDPRTYNRLPHRVRTLGTVSNRGQGHFQLKSGYNVALALTAPVSTAGRSVARITVDAVPGAGLGRVAGCDDAESVLTTINGIGPNAAGIFHFQVDECYQAQRRLTATAPGPGRTIGYASDADRAALDLSNHCQACCSCDDFVRTYQGLTDVYNDWAIVTDQAASVRDTLIANKVRWEHNAATRSSRALKGLALQEPACKAFVGASYCNPTACNIANVKLRFTVQRYTNGVADTGDLSEISVALAFVQDANTRGEQRYAPEAYYADGGAVFECVYAAALPGSAVIAKLRLCVPCTDEQVTMITLTAHGTAPNLPAATVPADILAIWAEAGLSSDGVLAVETALAPLTTEPAVGPCDCD